MMLKSHLQAHGCGGIDPITVTGNLSLVPPFLNSHTL